jgi:hypothetical protein
MIAATCWGSLWGSSFSRSAASSELAALKDSNFFTEDEVEDTRERK